MICGTEITKDPSSGLDDDIARIDLSKILWKLAHEEEGNGWDEATCQRLGVEYKRFLTLIKAHPGKAIVPTREIDEVWHAHILDTRRYREDCAAVFGGFVDHYPYFGIHDEFDRQQLDEAFEETRRLYRERFGVEGSYNAKASRCEGHACHAPSSCACRTQGACKNK